MKPIPLTRGFYALVDEGDYELLFSFKWHVLQIRSKCYAATTEHDKSIRMHRMILGATDGQVIDHLNGDSLDNRRSNIRIATVSHNNHNRVIKFVNKTGFRGVSKDRECDRWTANIRVNAKTRYLGYFSSPEDAAKAYDAAAKELHGEHAVTNFGGKHE